MGILITLGWIFVILGVVLVVCGFTVYPQAQRPGFGSLILGVILLVVGYLIPALSTGHYDALGTYLSLL